MAAQAGTINNEQDFALSLLYELDIPPTPDNVRALVAWQGAEGGFVHKNPLNTTQPAAGASNFNSIGVKTYPSWDEAVKATADTLRNGHYGGILSALKSGNATAVGTAVAASPWGTHGGLLARLPSVKALSPHDLFLAEVHGPDPDTLKSSLNDQVVKPATSALDAVGGFISTLLNPKTWLRVLMFIGGLVLGGFAIKQLATVGSAA